MIQAGGRYVKEDCILLDAVEVNHIGNPLWNEQSPYPKFGYQVFYHMDITKVYSFEAAYESTRRKFIRRDEHPSTTLVGMRRMKRF